MGVLCTKVCSNYIIEAEIGVPEAKSKENNNKYNKENKTNLYENQKDTLQIISIKENIFSTENSIKFIIPGNNNDFQKELNDKEEEIKKLKEEKNNEQKINNQIKKQNAELNQKLNEFQQKESKLKTDWEKLIIEQKRIKDLIAINQQNEIKNSKYKLILEQKEKDIENKIISLENQRKNFLKEKEKFNDIKAQFAQKEVYIKNGINQLNLRENKIKTKEEELNQREKIIINKEKKYKLILRGLNNIGATCYMNATLQSLSNSKKLTEYFLNTYKENPNRIMSNEYYKVIKNLWDVNSNINSYSPYSFKEVLSKENPLFAGVAANDSKDLINFLLERFHQELNIININNNNINNIDDFDKINQTNELTMLKYFLGEYTQKFNSPISNLFYGILETKSQCQGCNVIKYNFQVYSFLEFPLQLVNQYYFNQGKRPLFTNDGKNPDVNLYECFEFNRKIDLMTGDNQMYCNICKKLCNSYYSTILYSGPYYLIINLNRGKGAVYECKVNFPNQLNLINFITYKDGITVYELYAVICHLGPSSMSGHFVAYCKNKIDNQWYLYNDGFVTKCNKNFQYNDGMPYILFYRALTTD